MAIYCKKTNEKLIPSTIQIAPDCRVGGRVFKVRASVEQPRIFYLTDLDATNGEAEISSVIKAIDNPELTIKPLREQQRDAIVKALTLFSGNADAAARALGIAKDTLYRKLRQYRAAARHPRQGRATGREKEKREPSRIPNR